MKDRVEKNTFHCDIKCFNSEVNMKKVLCVLPVQERHKERIMKAAEGCEMTWSSIKGVTPEMVKEANVILGNAPAGMIEASDNLEFMQLNSAGADAYVKPGVLAEKTILANATGAYSKAVAEHCFMMALMLQKKLHLYRDHQKEHKWTDEGKITSITDATVLVIGLGDIGEHFARMSKALGAKKVIGVKRRPGAKPECVDELYLTEDVDRLLPEADIIATFMPGNAATYHFFSKERFELMKETAIFVNGGRGNAVASDVLYEALTQGQIMAAGIDVTEPEPLPAESPLWDLPNLLITPHVSGGFHLDETFERIVGIACDNLSAHLNGKTIRNVVDFTTGYKK